MLFERAKQYEDANFKGLFNFIKYIEKLKTSSNDLSSAKIIGENENVVRIMSIHKSKGLEFPVVFLSSTSKKFNFQDLNEEVLMHQDLGFGMQYINYDRAIEFPTLAKEALKVKLKNEIISEEMRVLYVALTRAKEKLIITGISKDLDKSLKDKEELLSALDNHKKIDVGILRKYNSYLDLLELVYLNNKDKLKDKILFNCYSYTDIENMISDEKNEVENINILDNIKKLEEKEGKENIENIKEIVEWEYPYKKACTLPTKTSVSKIKQELNDKNFERIIDEENNYLYKESASSFNVPEFINNEEKQISAAKKGSLMHLCFEKLDVNKDYSLVDIENFLNNLYEKNIINKEELQIIDKNKIYNFTKSNIFDRLKNAKKIYKEEPFYINVEAKRIEKDNIKDDIDEKVLVQGIIDLFFIDENDKLVLVDYKTDYVEIGNEQELVNKYKVQLDLYKEAIEKSLNRKVDEVLIYSVYLQKEIIIKN